jgi:hypothetical protein
MPALFIPFGGSEVDGFQQKVAVWFRTRYPSTTNRIVTTKKAGYATKKFFGEDEGDLSNINTGEILFICSHGDEQGRPSMFPKGTDFKGSIGPSELADLLGKKKVPNGIGHIELLMCNAAGLKSEYKSPNLASFVKVEKKEQRFARLLAMDLCTKNVCSGDLKVGGYRWPVRTNSKPPDNNPTDVKLVLATDKGLEDLTAELRKTELRWFNTGGHRVKDHSFDW